MENWEQINAVAQMQRYIEDHLDEPITLHFLAQVAGYSPWHCAKFFKELTGKAPFEYIRMCRLSKAALELRDRNLKIVDVAMDFVFDSHEGFSRAFRRQFGISPNEYKKNTPPIYLFHPWPVREYYYWLKGGDDQDTPLNHSFTIRVQRFPKRKLLLKRGVVADNYFAYSEEVGCDVWGLLCSIKEALCEEIGARPTGAATNLAAVEYAYKEFSAYGLSVQRQSFECMDWTHENCTLLVDGKEIPIIPAPYSLACDVKGEIICIGSLEELRSAKITGRIVLLHDDLACEPLMPKSFVFWNPDEHKEIISLLETGNPSAVLTVSHSTERFVPVIEDGDFELPCGIVAAEIAGTFYNGAVAVLKIRTHRTPATAANVIATYGSGEHKVCFSAHIDTKEGTSGALDNASGVAVLLALASVLSGHHYPYRVEFVLFNGEDYYSNPGEMTYLASHLSHPEEFVCAYNLDGIGLIGQRTSYSFYECPEKLMSSIASSAARFSDFEKVEPWPQGDHMLFASSGVPAIAITSCGIFKLVNDVLHTANDTLKLVDAEKLETIVNFLFHSI